MPSGPALQGSFSDIPLAELLALLAGGTRGAGTGTSRGGVVQCRGGLVATIVVHGSAVVWAEGDSAVPLEQMAAAAGIAPPEAVQQALGIARRSGSIVDGLLQAGVSEAELSDLMLDHTTSVLLPLLADDGVAAATSFEYHAGSSHPVGSDLGFAPDDLLAVLHQRAATIARFAAEGTEHDDDTVVHPLPDAVDVEVVLDGNEWRILAHLDGRNRIADVALLTGWSTFRVREVTAALCRRGLVVGLGTSG